MTSKLLRYDKKSNRRSSRSPAKKGVPQSPALLGLARKSNSLLVSPNKLQPKTSANNPEKKEQKLLSKGGSNDSQKKIATVTA